MKPFEKKQISKETHEVLSPRGNKERLEQFGKAHQFYSMIESGARADSFLNFCEQLFDPCVDAEMFDEAQIFLDRLECKKQTALKRKKRNHAPLNLDDCHREKVTAGTETIITMYEAMRDGKLSREEKAELLKKIEIERKKLTNLESAILADMGNEKKVGVAHYNFENERDKTDEVLETKFGAFRERKVS